MIRENIESTTFRGYSESVEIATVDMLKNLIFEMENYGLYL